MNKGAIKIGISILSLIALSLFSAYYLLPAFAYVNPSSTQFGSGAQLNMTAMTDMFVTTGNVVFIVANFSCNATTRCGGNGTAYANFSLIGGSSERFGALKAFDAGGNGTEGFALYQFNDTVNTGITNFRPAFINVNYTANDTNVSVGLGATVVMVNMSTIPGCPPEGENIQLPPVAPLLNGTLVNITDGCRTTCTGLDRAEANSTGQYALCGPTFGPDTTNFTRIAESGNFTNVPLVIDFPGKAKINFTGGVNMSTQQQASAIMQFAMENLMTGGRVGINDTEWNGAYNPNKPNMNLSARLTLYNISGILGISTGFPQIIKTAYGQPLTSGSTCPSGYCTGITWDGQNLTFSVGGFSDFGTSNDINVTLNTPANFSYAKNHTTLNNMTINFTYTPVWAASSMKNCTVYGNFTGTWTANNSNQTPLVSGVSNGIPVGLSVDGPYKWNVYCFDTATGYDYDSINFTVTFDTVLPISSGNATNLANGTFYATGNNYGFQINWTDTNGISNATFQLGRPTGSLTNYTIGTPAVQKTGSTFYINFTQDQIGGAGTYNYTWYANDSADNWNVSATVDYIIVKAPTLTSLFLNGTAGNRTYNVGAPFNFTVALNISAKSVAIAGNLTTKAAAATPNTQLDTTNMTPGAYNVTGFFVADDNYTASSQTYWATVYGWANATAFKDITINYAKSGAPVNIGCLVRNSNSSAALQGYYVEIYNGTTNFSAGRTDSNGLFNATLTMSADGSQDIKCAIYDNTTSFFNVSANGTSTLSSDFAAPSISITSPAASTYGSSSITFAYTASDSGSGISSCSYTLDSGSATSAGSSVSTSLTMLDGGHSLSVTCTDAAGNSGSASVTFGVSTGGGVSSPSVSSPSAETTKIIIPRIAAGAEKTIEITKGEHGVTEVSVAVKNSVAAVYIDVAKLPEKPALVLHEVSGNVYQYIEINKTNIKDEDIDKIKIRFKVKKSWINSNNISSDTIALNRYTTKWDKLPTVKINETADEIEYEAESPGLSYFAISGEVKPLACKENWSCTEWSACVDNKQTRVCTDANNCGTVVDKPAETQDCKVEKIIPKITPEIIYAAIAIILAAGVYFAFFKGKPKKK